jgi:hypothetical protein
MFKALANLYPCLVRCYSSRILKCSVWIIRAREKQIY